MGAIDFRKLSDGGRRIVTIAELVALCQEYAKPEDNGCWPWVGHIKRNGYGILSRGADVQIRAHRAAYEHLVGPIPDGLQLDHLCRNRCCINPAHLEPVTLSENVLRGESPPAQNARREACSKGHPYTQYGNWRRCRTCDNEASRRRYAAAYREQQAALKAAQAHRVAA